MQVPAVVRAANLGCAKIGGQGVSGSFVPLQQEKMSTIQKNSPTFGSERRFLKKNRKNT